MKPSHSVNDTTKSAVAGYVDSITIPAYRAAAVESRQNVVAVERRDPRRLWMTFAAGVAALALVAFAPAVVAQVQRVFQAFAVVNGHPTELATQQVSLQQLRGDMPFAVVRPVNIPPGYEEDIEEIGAGTSAARAMFHYSLPGSAPAVTIVESNAADRSPSDFRVAYRIGGNGPITAPAIHPPEPSAPGLHVVMKEVRNGVGTTIRVTPITWVTRGTRITMIAVPGALTRMQLNAILRSMR